MVHHRLSLPYGKHSWEINPLLRIAYFLLARKEMYVDLGEDYFEKQKQQFIVRHSVRRLEKLGYTLP